MLRQIYQSETADYRLWNGVVVSGGPGEHNKDLIVPPRQYAESLNLLYGMYWDNAGGLSSRDVYVLYGQIDVYADTLTRRKRWFFDAETGALIKADYINVFQTSIFQRPDHFSTSLDGHLFAATSYSTVYRYDKIKLDNQGAAIAHSEWEYPGGNTFLHKPLQNIRAHVSSELSTTTLAVHRIDTRASLRNIGFPGPVQAICDAGNDYAYIMCSGGVIVLVNLITGDRLMVTREPTLNTAFAYGNAALAFDPLRKRLLVCTQQPDSVDGAANTSIRGFYPVPQAVGLTPPIPTRAPRQGRKVTFISHAYGDAGEPIGGLQVRAAATGDAVLAQGSATTDAAGVARVAATLDDAGTATIDIEAENGNP